MRVVVDTSVVISALLLPKSRPRRAFDVAMQQGRVLVSRATLSELDSVLRRPKFDRYLAAELRSEFLSAYCLAAELIDVTEEIRVCRDPRDDKFLELAVSGHAEVIVSGDEDLQTLNPLRNIAILSPDAFLTRAGET